MYKQMFQNFSDGHLIALGFVLFMGTFLGALVWTLFVREKSFYTNLSHLPISDGVSDGVNEGEPDGR